MTTVSRSSWPLILNDGELTLRPLRFKDRGKWLSSQEKPKLVITMGSNITACNGKSRAALLL